MANNKPVVLLTGNMDTIKTMGEQFLGFNIDSPESPGIVLTRDPEINFDYSKAGGLLDRVKFWLLPAALNISVSKAKSIKAGWHAFDLIKPTKHAESLASAMNIWSGRLIAIHWDEHIDREGNTDMIDKLARYQVPFITITDCTAHLRTLVHKTNIPIMAIRPEVVVTEGVDALIAGIAEMQRNINDRRHELTVEELN